MHGAFVLTMASLARAGVGLAQAGVDLWCRAAVRGGASLADTSLALERIEPGFAAAQIATTVVLLGGTVLLARNPPSKGKVLGWAAIPLYTASAVLLGALLSPALNAGLSWRTHGALRASAQGLEVVAVAAALLRTRFILRERHAPEGILRAALATLALTAVAIATNPLYVYDPFDDAPFAWALRILRVLPFLLAAFAWGRLQLVRG